MTNPTSRAHTTEKENQQMREEMLKGPEFAELLRNIRMVLSTRGLSTRDKFIISKIDKVLGGL